MRLSISETKNAASFYVIKSVTIDGRRTSKVVESLGTRTELEQKLGGRDPVEWANEYIEDLNRKEKEMAREIRVKYSPIKKIPKEEQRSYNGGYLFLQRIYHQLSLDKICADITAKQKFTFDLNSILSRLVYSRVIYPASKLSTLELSKKFIEQPAFELQHIYRALEVIAKESDFIQSELYKNSATKIKRNSGVIYYDCTNFFFEIEEEDGMKKYGKSKEHRPNPIVQMGLFLDADGIPLAFVIFSGNDSEQPSMTPLERKLISDFNLSKFVVCTDAGLSSLANRKFNSRGGRAFITTQSVKKLRKELKEWALDHSKSWRLIGPDPAGGKNPRKEYDISEVDEALYKCSTFYKEQWIKDDEGFEQRLIVTYSIKYRDYHRRIREGQIERAQKLIESNPKKMKKANQNDFKRFISKTSVTEYGELADKEVYSINEDTIAEEEKYDGFYAACTVLEDSAEQVIKVLGGRWEIEETFRILKSEFKARPVYLKRDDRISAHFTTCFIALMLYRLLEYTLTQNMLNMDTTGENGARHIFTCHKTIDALRDMNFLQVKGEGFIPAYTRTDLTDALHEAFGFRTDYEIVTEKNMKNIFRLTKSR